VRLEAVKSLVSLYAKEDYIVSLQAFTERFKPRLIEMATCDTENTVRVTVIQVLSAIDAQGLLEEDQRAQLCLLVFDADAKVRKAVSSFVRGVWEETREQRLVGKSRPTENERDRAGLKALAMLLLRWSRALDRDAEGDAEGAGDGDSSSQGDGPSSQRDVAVAIHPSQKGRIALAVEALWEDVPAVSDWEAMIDLLLLDHSARQGATNGDDAPVSRRKKTKKVVDDMVVDECWRLEESEEGVVLEVMVSAMRRSKAEATGGKKVCDSWFMNAFGACV
jgi:cohesin complex subunit SA-1/2